MSNYIKAVIMSLAAVFLAYAVKTAGMAALGQDPETNLLNDYSDMMLEARELFLEYDEEIRELAYFIADMDGLRLRRCADSTAIAWTDGQNLPMEEAFAQFGAEDPARLADLANTIFAGAEVSSENSEGEVLVSGFAQVINVSVSDGEVLFFTHYTPTGCVGIASTVDGYAGGYESIELIEEWRIFYEMNA